MELNIPPRSLRYIIFNLFVQIERKTSGLGLEVFIFIRYECSSENWEV